MIKKDSGQHRFQTQTLINAICHVYKHFAFETLIKSTAERKFSALKKTTVNSNACKRRCVHGHIGKHE
ncbi:unnamed protein product, partial [Staurois parvus]